MTSEVMATSLTPTMPYSIPSETRQTRLSRNRIIATHLANNIVERFRMEPVKRLAMALSSMAAGRALVEEDELLTPPQGDDAYRALLVKYERYALFELDPGSNGRKGVLKAIVKWREGPREREQRIAVVCVDANFPGGRP